MEYLKRSIEIKWPIFLFEIIFIIGGLLLVISGTKARKSSPLFAWISVITGLLIIAVSLYFLFWTFMVGYNS